MRTYSDVSTVNGVSVYPPEIPFVFQPGGQSQGQIFTDWDDLTNAYDAWYAQTTTPGYAGSNQAVIIFDSTYGAVTIPARAGAVPFQVRGQTSFAALQSLQTTAGMSTGPRTQMTVADDAHWQFYADEDGTPRFRAAGLEIIKGAGVGGTEMMSVAEGTSFEVLLDNTSLSSSSTHPYYASTGTRDFAIYLQNSDLQDGVVPHFLLEAATEVHFEADQSSTVRPDTLASAGVLSAVTSLVGNSVKLSSLGLQLPDYVEVNGPSASAQVRPAPGMTVLCDGQLSTYGGTSIPQILQAVLFLMSANPSDTNTISITDGTTTETFTFLLAAGGAFQVQIGVNVAATLANLASQITADSVLWRGAYVDNPQGPGKGVAFIRQTQTVESYPDRLYGTIAGGAGALVGSFVQADRTVLLTYSHPIFAALDAADAGTSQAGFASVAPLADAQLVTVIDGRSDGIYQAQNPLSGSGTGRWIYVASPVDPTLAITAGGAAVVGRQTRGVVITLAGGVASVIGLQTSIYPANVPLLIRRTDADGASSATLTPTSGTINGAASLAVPVTSGLVLFTDGTNWYSAGAA